MMPLVVSEIWFSRSIGDFLQENKLYEQATDKINRINACDRSSRGFDPYSDRQLIRL